MSGEGLKKDPAWNYAHLANPSDINSVTCNFCGKVTKGGIYRAKQHLIGGSRNAKACTKCPPHVKEELKAYMEKKKQDKEQVNLAPDFDELGNDEEEDDDCIEVTSKRRMSVQSGTSHRGSNNPTIVSKPPKQKGPMDMYFTPNPETVVQKRKGMQTKLDENNAAKKEMRSRACTEIAKWMYDAGIPFNAVKYDSFQTMIEAIGQYGPGMKAPTYHEVRVPLLKKEVENTKEVMKDHEEEWKKNGCSIMADGWKDRRERTLINFLVNCPKGSMFLESVDASDYSKSGNKMFELLSDCVDKVGPSNVVQVVTDSASANVLAGKLLEVKYKYLFWTPCAAHCLDLMLEDLFNMPNMKRTFQRAIVLNGYIYNRPGVVNLMRKFTNQKELLRPAKTRFATAFITLSRIHQQKNNLRKMFTSEEWHASKWAKEEAGKRAVNVVLMPSFWNHVVFALKVAGPLVKVLRLVDGERKPPMGYIYEAMDRAKEAIAKSFDGKEEKYREVFKIIDNRWDIQLHRPLHAAGYFLNPEFFYTNPNIEQDGEVMKGLYECVRKLVPNVEVQDKITDELEKYKNAEDLFGHEFAIRQRGKKSPAAWWAAYGSSTPNLQKFAMKILSLTCSASGCERNWSVFEHVGYRHIDCAAIYGNEKEIGLVLKKLFEDGVVKREDLWITSKLWHTEHAPEDVPVAFDRTLRDLQLDYVDLYLIHSPLRMKKGTVGMKPENLMPTDIPSTWKAMEALYDSGKARAIGVSNFSSKKLADLLDVARIPPAVNQVECHPIWQQTKLREFCKSVGVHLSGWSPLGAPGAPRISLLKHPVVNTVAEKLGKTPAQVALRWGLQMGHSVLPKSTNEARIKENFNVFDWSIPDDLFTKFSEIEQGRLFKGEYIVHETLSPYKTVEELWDGEV